MKTENNKQKPETLEEEIEALLNSSSPEQFSEGVLDGTLRDAAAIDVELFELLLKCAIPKSFDVDVIGFLREKPNDNQRNSELLSLLCGFNFIQPQQDESFSYHESTRNLILRRWERPENKAELISLRDRLGEFYLQKSFQHVRTNQHLLALKDINEAIEMQGQQSLTLAIRGSILRQLGAIEQSFSDLNRSIELEPDSALARTYRAFALTDLEEYEEALEDFAQARLLDPSYSVAYNGRGITYAAMRRHDEALAEYNRAIELDHRYVRAYFNRANTYYRLGRLDEALEDYEHAVEIDPEYARAYNAMGNIYDEKQQYKEALNEYNIAIQLEPNNGDYLDNRGCVLATIGEYESAIADLLRAIEINDEDFTYKYDLAVTYVRWKGLEDSEQQLSEAEALLRKTSSKEKDNASIVYCMAGILALRGETEQALINLKHAIAQGKIWRTIARNDIAWDHLRDNSEFNEIVK